MASVKKQKQRLQKSLVSRFEKLKADSYLTENQLKAFSKEIENLDKKSLKELKTLSKGMNSRNVKQVTKERVNYELKKAYGKEVKLTSTQIQELGKKGLINQAKEFLDVDSTSKRLTQTQERMRKGDLSVYNIEKILTSERTKDIISKSKKKKEHLASITDIEYLEEIARRTGIAKYIGLVEDAKEDETVMNNLKKQFEKVERNDYYDDILKGADITSYYIDSEKFEQIQEENNPFLEIMEN